MCAFVSVSLLAAIFQTLFESLLKGAGRDSVQDGVQGAVYGKNKNHHPQNEGTWRRQIEREKRKCRLDRIVQEKNCKAILADKCSWVLMAVECLILSAPKASAPQPSTNQNAPLASDWLLA